MENNETDDEDETNLFGTEIQTAASMLSEEENKPQPNPIVEARGDGLKSAFEIELNGLMLETDIIKYGDKLDEIYSRIQAAGLEVDLDRKLNETADVLTDKICV